MILIDAPSSNYKERTQTITAIVIHDSDGHDIKDVLSAYACPDVEKSMHYVMAHDGNVIRCVQDAHKAFHAGDHSSLHGQFDVNDFSIGIMLVVAKNAAESGEKYSAEQFESLITLITGLVKDYKIPLNRVVGHDYIENANDPGESFPWFEFLNSVGTLVAQEDIATSDMDGA